MGMAWCAIAHRAHHIARTGGPTSGARQPVGAPPGPHWGGMPKRSRGASARRETIASLRLHWHRTSIKSRRSWQLHGEVQAGHHYVMFMTHVFSRVSAGCRMPNVGCRVPLSGATAHLVQQCYRAVGCYGPILGHPRGTLRFAPATRRAARPTHRLFYGSIHNLSSIQ